MTPTTHCLLSDIFFHSQGLTSSRHLNWYWFALQLGFYQDSCSHVLTVLSLVDRHSKSHTVFPEPSGGLLPAQGEEENITTAFNAGVRPARLPGPPPSSLPFPSALCLAACVSAPASHLCALPGPPLSSLHPDVTSSEVTLCAQTSESFLEILAPYRKVWAQPTEIRVGLGKLQGRLSPVPLTSQPLSWFFTW